jgi:hypothetical protein
VIALLAGLGIGLWGGITGTSLVTMLLLRRGELSTAVDQRVQEDEPEVIEMLTPHEAMRAEQLRSFGDRLAAGDTALRERLRRFERGGR